MLTHTRFLGYDRNDDGGLIINKEQAEIVTRIFNEYLNGKGCKRIASELAGDNIMGINGTSKWYPGTIKRMLSNEKYKGDALLQKSYTADFLTKKRVKNKRELTQYYIENSHPAIIDKTIWETVQLETKRRKKYIEKYKVTYFDFVSGNHFRSRVICGCCKRIYGKSIWNSTEKALKRHIWQCGRKYRIKGEVKCTNKHIDHYKLYDVFIESFNKMVDRKEFYIEKWGKNLKSDDLLLKFRAKSFIDIFKNAEKIDEFDEELYFKLIERFEIIGAKIIVWFLDGSFVEV